MTNKIANEEIHLLPISRSSSGADNGVTFEFTGALASSEMICYLSLFSSMAKCLWSILTSKYLPLI